MNLEKISIEKSCTLGIDNTISNKKGNYRHGMKNTKFYKSWQQIIQRCTNVNNKRYPQYGGRGIKVCDRWLNSFENFRDDMLLTWKKELSIDRIDNEKGYFPENCRWTTQTIQNRNTRVIYLNNLSGYRGVSFHKASGKWSAQISINGKKKHLGTFINALDAAKSYDKYVVDNNLEHNINGVFIDKNIKE